jgi:hypothetical protein
MIKPGPFLQGIRGCYSNYDDQNGNINQQLTGNNEGDTMTVGLMDSQREVRA